MGIFKVGVLFFACNELGEAQFCTNKRMEVFMEPSNARRGVCWVYTSSLRRCLKGHMCLLLKIVMFLILISNLLSRYIKALTYGLLHCMWLLWKTEKGLENLKINTFSWWRILAEITKRWRWLYDTMNDCGSLKAAWQTGSCHNMIGNMIEPIPVAVRRVVE